jgi:hypothetical protein
MIRKLVGAVAFLVLAGIQLLAQNGNNPIQVALLRWYHVNTVTQFPGDGGCTSPSGPVFDGAHIWVACSGINQIEELNASDGKWLKTITPVFTGFASGTTPVYLLYDGQNIWAANQNTTSAAAIVKVNASTGAVSAPVSVGSGPFAMAFDGTYVWVSNYNSNNMSRVPQSGSATTIPLTGCTTPLGVAFDTQSIWVSCTGSGTVQQLNLSSGALIRTISLATGSSAPFSLAFDGISLWASSTSTGTSVWWINNGATTPGICTPTSSCVASSPITVSAGVGGLVFDGKYIWVVHGSTSGSSITKILASSPLTAVPGNPFTVMLDVNGGAFDGGNLWFANQHANTVSKF